MVRKMSPQSGLVESQSGSLNHVLLEFVGITYGTPHSLDKLGFTFRTNVVLRIVYIRFQIVFAD